MSHSDVALVFSCGNERLVGLLALPESAAGTGVVIIVGGPQYRAGSHRQFVLLSRALAGKGYAAFRFDYRGMGDSTGVTRNFENVQEDIAVAIDAFVAACPQVKKIVLWGLCDGASAALLYWQTRRDDRIAGMCLLNPWVRSAQGLARTQLKHYYGQRFMQREFWLKLMHGEVKILNAVESFFHGLRTSFAGTKARQRTVAFQSLMAQALTSFPGKVALVLSGRDYTAKEFLEYARMDVAWSAALGRACVHRYDVAEADHTFSTAASRAEVEQMTLRLLRDVEAAA